MSPRFWADLQELFETVWVVAKIAAVCALIGWAASCILKGLSAFGI